MRNSSSVKRFILVDCNNFFVSCERVFNPALMGKPVVVLSNNDGCVISRSNEAKALGIAMGAAAFECEALFKKHNVQIFSSNFTLYGDMSARIMQTLAAQVTDIEVYSIDEAFLFAPKVDDYTAFAQFLRALVKQHTGIPISVGIGPTKTLAKVANKLAKKRPEYEGVFDITDHPEVDGLLTSMPVRDVWGVGYKYEKMLSAYGVKTARDLKYSSDVWIKKKMTIVGLKTVQELRGQSCFNLADEVPSKKSITVSRSFGRLISNKQKLQEALSVFMIRAAQKLRKERALTTVITVFIATSKYHDDERYFNTVNFTFAQPTDYTPALLNGVTACLDVLFKPGLLYKKAGVMLNNLVGSDHMQLDMFAPSLALEEQKQLMKACDTINARFGQHVLSYISAGVDQEWKSKRLKKSAHFTTNWHELLTITL